MTDTKAGDRTSGWGDSVSIGFPFFIRVPIPFIHSKSNFARNNKKIKIKNSKWQQEKK